MNRLKPSWICLCLIQFSACFTLASESPRPNLLFILTEDQGAHAGYLGTPGLKTPAIDSLASTGVVFLHAFVAYPVCSASKASIYTGLHNHSNGILNNTLNHHRHPDKVTAADKKHPLYQKNRIHAGIPTLIEILKNAGYHQGVTHKLHVIPVEKFPYDEFLKGNGKAVTSGFISRAKAVGKPWHLFCNVPESHRPYPNSDDKPIRVKPDEVRLPPYLPDTPVVRKDWAEYLAGIEEVDAHVHGILEALQESGEAERTIVVFLGDHGPTFARGKMTLYDGGLRTPLIIRTPDGKPGRRDDILVSTVDLAPTLLDLLGLPPLPQSHGHSLAAVLRDPAASSPREFVFAEISNRGPLPNDGIQERSIQDKRWKLIQRWNTAANWRQVNADIIQRKPWGNRTYQETLNTKDRFPEAFRILAEQFPQTLKGKVPELELFDLTNDPFEMKNLATDPSHADQLERLESALLDWRKQTQDASTLNP
jgi:N-sulfoglucosamine sulfohydrolase